MGQINLLYYKITFVISLSLSLSLSLHPSVRPSVLALGSQFFIIFDEFVGAKSSTSSSPIFTKSAPHNEFSMRALKLY